MNSLCISCRYAVTCTPAEKQAAQEAEKNNQQCIGYDETLNENVSVAGGT